MSAELRTPRLSTAVRRRLVHGALIAIAVGYIAVLVLAPLVGIVWQVVKAGWKTVVETLTLPDVLHAFYLTAVISAITVVVTSVLGVVVALVLTRDHFPGKHLLSAIVDLPLAVSPIIVGLMAVLLFGRTGWFEPWLFAHGIQVA